jgi:protein-S-isoprenylcysteine O-methyltransferase Ste14
LYVRLETKASLRCCAKGPYAFATKKRFINNHTFSVQIHVYLLYYSLLLVTIRCRLYGDYRMGIRERLINVVYCKATGPERRRRLITLIAPLFLLFCIIFIIFASLWIDQYLGFPSLCPWPVNVVFAIPILAAGSFLWMWSLVHFFKSKGTPVPFNPPPKLVDTGPYAHVRNPMVSGVVITVFGLGLLLKSISLAFIITPVLFIFIYVELKVIEEPELELRLGEAYKEYKEKVPMFFPCLKFATRKRGS